jgi:hypothetical protein
MKKFSTLIAIILLIPLFISQKPPRNGDKSYVEGQIMVQLRSDVPQRQQQMLQEVLADFQSVNLAMVEKLSQRMNIFLLSYNPGVTDEDRLLEEIKANPNVELAQFNHYIQQRELIPNDEFFGIQWNMHNTGQTGGTNDADIDGPEAWGLGNSGVTATGDTIIVAIVDDGFDINHEDLIFWKNYHDIPGNNIDDDNNGYIDDYDGWNAWANNGEITEKDHGTHVSGIAAAQGNNSTGVTGVNLHVKLMPVVVGTTVESIVVAGYSYLLEMRTLYNETGGEKGAFIVSSNCSFGVDNGQPDDYPIWGAMYDSLGVQGILSAGATANANWNIDEVGDIPTAFPSDFLITVTNTDKDDVKSAYAAYGLTTIDLGAPGTAIYSTRQSNTYGYKTGCSMSAPHVTGAVAYMFSVASEEFMTAYHNDPAGMALLIKQYLLAGTDPLPSLEGKTVSGGRLNIYHAAEKMMNPDITFIPPSILKMMQPEEQDSVSLEFTNNSSLPVSYSITYPDTLEWISLSGPLSGSVAAYSSGQVMVHFNTSGMSVDTLSTFLTFSYGDGKQAQVPVHLYVILPDSALSLAISTDHQAICQGGVARLTSDVVGGSGNYTYSWTSDPEGLMAMEADITVSPVVTTTYFLEVNDGVDVVTDSLLIVVNALPDKPVISTGPASVDNYTATSSIYSCGGASNAPAYQWYVTPSEAGTTSSTGSAGEFSWSAGYTGSVLITVVGVNDCGNSEMSDAFTTEIYSSEGLNEYAGNGQLIIYPNPAKEILNFRFSILNSGMNYLLFIYSSSGKQINEIKVPDFQNEMTLNIEAYQEGVYFVVLKGNEQIIESYKFIIDK